MPNRLLKEGICTSDAINLLSSDSEVLFYRLLVAADDFGRMDGRVQIVKSQCFPLKDYFTAEKIKDLLLELIEADLIQFYHVDNKPFFFIKKWDQRVRSKGKYPEPPEESQEVIDSNSLTDDSNVRTDDGLGLGLGLGLGSGSGKGETKEKILKKESQQEKPKPKKIEPGKKELPTQDLVDDETWNTFLELRKKIKAVNSPQAINCLIKELTRLSNQGHDPTEVINQSIRSSWKDVYPLKNRGLQVVSQHSREEYNRQQTEIAKRKLFGLENKDEKDITHEATTL